MQEHIILKTGATLYYKRNLPWEIEGHIIKRILFSLLLILASGSCSRGAQISRLIHRKLSSLAYLLNLAQDLLTHSSKYSSNSSSSKTEVEIAHIEIPISNYVYHSLDRLDWLIEPIGAPIIQYGKCSINVFTCFVLLKTERPIVELVIEYKEPIEPIYNSPQLHGTRIW